MALSISSLPKSPVEPLPLPRRVLRRLLLSHGVGIGSRVLDSGCGDGRLVRFLESLGIDASGIDSSPAAIAAARAAAPARDYYLDRGGEALPFRGRSFDLILLRGLERDERSLLSQESRIETARLLACVRPGGALAIVAESDGGPERQHSASCLEGHLAGFPGSVSRQEFAFGGWGGLFRKWLSGGAQPDFLTISLQTPTRGIPRQEWLRSPQGTASELAACCEWASGATRSEKAA